MCGILGLLEREPSHGYDLKRAYDEMEQRAEAVFAHHPSDLDRLPGEVERLVPGHGGIAQGTVEIRDRLERDLAYLEELELPLVVLHDQELAHVTGPKLSNGTAIFWDQLMLDVLFEYPIQSDQSRFSPFAVRWRTVEIASAPLLRWQDAFGRQSGAA